MKKIFLILTFLTSQLSFAAPVNDECSGAILLTPGTTCVNYAGSIQTATTSAATTSCINMYNDLFYKFVAVSPNAIVTVSPTAGLSMKVAILDDCAGSALYCSLSPSSGSPVTITTTNLIIGNTYYIKAGSSSSSNPYVNFNVCVVSSPNDEISGAIAITPAIACTNLAGTLVNATTSATTSSCTAYNDVFYKFIASATFVKITVAPTTPSSLDLVVSTFDASSSTPLNCVDNQGAGITESLSMSNLVIGNTYYVKIASKIASPIYKAFNLCIQNAPVNNECANATTLSTPTPTILPANGTLLNTSLSNVVASCPAQSDVFYKFMANSNTTIINVVPASGLDVVVSIMESSCGGIPIVCMNDLGTGGIERITSTDFVIGNVYYIRVASVNAIPAVATFSISAQIPPVNDNCSSAINLTASEVCSNIFGNLSQATTSPLSSICGGYNDMFYKFTAPASTMKIAVTPYTGLDIGVSIFSSCTAIDALYCVNAAPNGTVENIAMTNLTPGSVYYIKIASIIASPAIKMFNICLSSPPYNDDCAGSTLITATNTCTPSGNNITEATNSPVPSSCTFYNDLFFKFVAGTNVATVTAGSTLNLDLVLSVMNSCGGTEIACVNNTGLAQEEKIYLEGLTIGSTYYIRVGSAVENPVGKYFDLCVQNPQPNDNCPLATYLTPDIAPISASFKNAFPSSTSTAGCVTYDDIYYFINPTGNAYAISVTPAADLDVIVSLYSSCGGSLISCVNNGGVGQVETAILNSTPGVRYYLKISNASPQHTDKAFTISLVTKTNDEKEFANTLSAAGWCDNSINLTNATQSSGRMVCDNSTDPRFNFKYDVWYKFVAISPSYTISASRTYSNSYGVELSNSVGTSLLCAVGAIQAGSGSFAATLNSQINTLTIGDTYYLRMGYDGLGNTSERFTLCATPINVPTTGTAGSAASQYNLHTFPNPSNGVMTVQTSITGTKVAELISYNGSSLLRVTFDDQECQINTETIPQGVYLLRVTDDSGNQLVNKVSVIK